MNQVFTCGEATQVNGSCLAFFFFFFLISNLRSNDLRDRFEVGMASEAVGGNMHMDARVIKVAGFKY